MRFEPAPRSDPPLARYPSLAAFYAADPRRLDSREKDVGLWWRDGAEDPLHRAAWVSDTGELYLVRLGPGSAGGGAVEVLAVVAHHERLERVLEGWRDHCGEPRSLPWLRERAARFSQRAKATSVRLAATAAGAGATLLAAGSLVAEIA